MNEINLSKKVLKNLHRLRLENMLKVEVKDQPDIFHTFHKIKGVVIDSKKKRKYIPSQREKLTVQFNEKIQKLAETEAEFKELLEIWLIEKKIEISNTSLRQTAISKLIDDLINARADYNKICLNNSYDVNYKLLDATKLYIEFLKNSMEQKQTDKTEFKENSHPSIFEDGAFEIFKKWMEVSKDEPEKKISFIFQKLKKKEKLRNTTFKALSIWALEFEYIDKQTYNKLYEEGRFRAYRSQRREELYTSLNDSAILAKKPS